MSRRPHLGSVIALAASALATCVFTACGGGTTGGATASGGGHDSGTTCAELAASASGEVSAVIEARRSCTTSADCAQTSLSAACFDACGRAVAASAEADVNAAREKVNGAQCRQFLEQGCKLVIPPCVPPRAPTCSNSLCQ